VGQGVPQPRRPRGTSFAFFTRRPDGAQIDNAIATAIPLMVISHPCTFRRQPFSRNVRHKQPIRHALPAAPPCLISRVG
jgi:hypothetical protein